MRKLKSYQFYTDHYHQNFYFIPGWKRAELLETFEVDPGKAQGMVFGRPDGIIIWIEEFSYENLDYLVHECVHAANVLFEQRGLLISTKNDEAQAYMVQWIFDNCKKILKLPKHKKANGR